MPLPLMETSPVIELTPAPATAAEGASTMDRFAPGAVLADRYRIVAALGRGGMGEVYRADDLKLGHPVALKFLSRALSADPRLLEYFRAEVRNGRQVSHPNVCRIYDIGEFERLTFLTMEYIDGEDLASLLRRIGRLPPDKALEIAHQLCAGLAAAHDVGLVHRDLKPANIMLDGRGHARITDFGLAVAVSDSAGRQQPAGTPAYMAPEQRAGAPATVKSDIYSLGLVLYEIFTGKHALEEDNLPAWRGAGRSGAGSSPSDAGTRQASRSSSTSTSSSADVDPAVKRAILRCLERDPAQRPASVRDIAVMLPGGDPLAAALAAGETPSPDVVAAAGQEIAISAQGAALLLVAIVVMAGLLVPLSRWGTFIGLAPSVSPREVLEARADTIAKQAGVSGRAADSHGYFSAALSYAKWRSDQDPHWYNQMDDAVPDVYRFTYRTSPEWLFAFNSFSNPDLDDPPLTVPGMTATVLDGSRRLVLFRAVPPASDRDLPKSSQTDWAGLFAAGGWDFNQFKTAEPHDLPHVAFDSRSAWAGVVGGVPLHVEGASLRGKPVAFTLSGPWVGREAGFGSSSRASQIAFDVTIFVVLPIVGGIWARRNLRLGRGDPTGATRLSIVVVLVIALNTLLAQHWVAHPSIVNAVIANAGLALILAIAVWLAYVAIEPMLRRHAPHLMISWTRLLSGRFRDGMVGRDVLIGSAAAFLIAVVHMLFIALPHWFPLKSVFPYPGTASLSDAPHFVGNVISQLWVAIVVPLSIAFSYGAMRRRIRKPWIAAIILYAIIWPLSFNSEGLFLQLTVGTVGTLLFVFVFLRFGLLALAAEVLIENLIFFYPPVLRPDTWYFSKALIVLLLVLGISVYAFRCALAGRQLFAPLAEEFS